MRNLKKILALVLALVMSFSLMATANAFTDDAKITATYDEAVEVLNALKVFQGYEDGSFQPQGSITRAEVAAIIYRIVTGDVEDKQVSIYADYNKFNDVKSTSWYAGYVNFCANAEYIKGYDAKTFGPNDPVTGYQALAMILRAVGYDKNGEFTGSDWQVQTAAVGKKLNITDNVSEGTLGTAASREVVAEILFQAIQKPQVTYTLAFGYNDSTLGVKNDSIGKETFGLYVGPRMNIDAWGRPGYNWYASKVTGTAALCTIEEAYLAAYTTPMTECDVATDLGISVRKVYDTYTNGSANYVQNGETIIATATTSTIGAQGRLTEIYKDRIVYIDTMLASVANVTNARFDTAGHLAVPAQLTLRVWDQDNQATTVVLSNGATNWEYTVGQMLLVNATTVNGSNHADVINNTATQHVEILGVATSIQGAQTMLWWNAAQHTIDGQTYNDAFCFHLDAAGNNTIRYNWWMDQYGNIIGATELDRDSFAVIKDMIWVRGTPGYAQATLIDMAGNESTVTVRSIDGDNNGAADFVAWDTDDAVPTLNDRDFAQFTANFAHVSTDSSKNAIYMGYALYRVTTNDDGSVNLEGWEDLDTDNTYDANSVETIINHVNGATIDTTASAILVGGNVQIHVDDSTRFLVRTGNRATGFTYTAYTGTDSLPQFVPGSVELFYDGVQNANGIARAVYVKDAQLQSDFGSHLFVLTNNYSRVAGTQVYSMNVMVDGEARTIATTEVIAQKLAANVGKLFHVTWNTATGINYGMVASADLVNEATDAEMACNYLSGQITLGNGVLISDGVSYHINNAAVVSTIPGINTVADLDRYAVDTYGIWVVSRTAPYNVATTVYVGEKLNTGVAASVSAEDNNGAIYAGVLNAAGTTFIITLPEDKTVAADLAELNVVATSDVNARLDVTGVLDTCATVVPARVRFLDSFRNAADYLAAYRAAQYTFTVTAEDGRNVVTYTVDIVEQDNVIDDMITEIIKDGDGTTQIATDLDGYKNIADAVANRTVLDVRQSSVIHLTEDGSKVVPFGNATYPVRVVAFTNSADATLDNFNLRLADVAATTTNDGNVSVASLIAGNVVVLRYVQQGTGAYFYIAFEVTNNAAN